MNLKNKYKLRLQLANLNKTKKDWMEKFDEVWPNKSKYKEITKGLEWFDEQKKRIFSKIEIRQAWSIMELWNKQLSVRTERPLEPRIHIWASDIGKNHWERFMKMKAVPYTNPFDERTLRKFAAGDFFERIIGYVLMTCGILKYDNKWFSIPETDKSLRISGKLDFMAGGKPDWNNIKDDLETNMLFKIMPVLEGVAKRLVEHFSEQYPLGLSDLIYEIKSINSMVFWQKKDYLREAYPHHQLQDYTYLKYFNVPEGRMLYISKDDLTIAELPVYLSSKELKEAWNKDIELMTEYIRSDKEPPMPERAIFDPRKKLSFQIDKKKHTIIGSWTTNWQIDWSMYKDLIIGKNPEKWTAETKKIISTKNAEPKEEYKKRLGTSTVSPKEIKDEKSKPKSKPKIKAQRSKPKQKTII